MTIRQYEAALPMHEPECGRGRPRTPKPDRREVRGRPRPHLPGHAPPPSASARCADVLVRIPGYTAVPIRTPTHHPVKS